MIRTKAKLARLRGKDTIRPRPVFVEPVTPVLFNEACEAQGVDYHLWQHVTGLEADQREVFEGRALQKIAGLQVILIQLHKRLGYLGKLIANK